MNCARLRLSSETTTILFRDGWLIVETADEKALRAQVDEASGEQLLSVSEVSSRTGFTVGAVRHWIRKAKLPAVRVGREFRVRVRDLEQFLAGKVPGSVAITSRINRRRKAVVV